MDMKAEVVTASAIFSSTGWLCYAPSHTIHWTNINSNMASRIAVLTTRAGPQKMLPLSSTPPVLRRSSSMSSKRFPQGVQFWPTYFDVDEQKVLLQASLYKLDNSESIKSRKRRRMYLKALPVNRPEPTEIQNIFLPDEYYEFQEVCTVCSA